MIHVADLRVLQILLEHVLDARILGAGIHANLRNLTRAGFERETRVGAADIGKQPRTVGVLTGARNGHHFSLHTSRHRV